MGFLNVKGFSISTNFDFKFISRSGWRALYFIGFSTGYVYILKAIEETKRAERLKTQNLLNTLDNERLENELVRVENDFLRSQINPHFLFNTLSFIYNGTRKAAPEAASAILSLSDMMRYSLKKPGSSETIALSEEIEQVENLINLHKLRTKNATYINLNVRGDVANVKFLPLVLLTLVENVFKHGNLSQEKQPGQINVKYENGNLTISTENLISGKSHGESNKVGMENIQKRLDSYYKGRSKLSQGLKGSNIYYSELTVSGLDPA